MLCLILCKILVLGVMQNVMVATITDYYAEFKCKVLMQIVMQTVNADYDAEYYVGCHAKIIVECDIKDRSRFLCQILMHELM